MGSQNLICTGCGCLCDDIQVETEAGGLSRVENACARGAAYLFAGANPKRRARSTVAGREVSVEEAIGEAARLVSETDNLLVYGPDDSTVEAQAAAIELARAAGGTIDDASSLSYGPLIRSILEAELPACSLSEVKDNADLLIYWGSNPPHTHPRHLSRFTYYAYTDLDPAGWLPKNVTLSCIEVRDTEFTSICRPGFRVEPGGDGELIESILDGRHEGTQEAGRLAELIETSHFCVIFCGEGLCYSLGGEFGRFNQVVHRFGRSRRMAVIPMVAEANMRGFCQSLHRETGYVNRVSFARGVSHGNEFSFLEQVRQGVPGCVLIVCADPFSALPQSLMGNLQDQRIICLDHFATPTTSAADVVIPTALPGLESGGSAARMDGDEVALTALVKADCPSVEDVLKRLTEGLG